MRDFLKCCTREPEYINKYGSNSNFPSTGPVSEYGSHTRDLPYESLILGQLLDLIFPAKISFLPHMAKVPSTRILKFRIFIVKQNKNETVFFCLPY